MGPEPAVGISHARVRKHLLLGEEKNRENLWTETKGCRAAKTNICEKKKTNRKTLGSRALNLKISEIYSNIGGR